MMNSFLLEVKNSRVVFQRKRNNSFIPRVKPCGNTFIRQRAERLALHGDNMGQRHRHFRLAQPRRVQLAPDTDPQGRHGCQIAKFDPSLSLDCARVILQRSVAEP